MNRFRRYSQGVPLDITDGETKRTKKIGVHRGLHNIRESWIPRESETVLRILMVVSENTRKYTMVSIKDLMKETFDQLVPSPIRSISEKHSFIWNVVLLLNSNARLASSYSIFFDYIVNIHKIKRNKLSSEQIPLHIPKKI